MSVFLWVSVGLKAGQTVVCDLQDKAVVNNAVRGLEFTVREDDAVLEENHALQREREREEYKEHTMLVGRANKTKTK